VRVRVLSCVCALQISTLSSAHLTPVAGSNFPKGKVSTVGSFPQNHQFSEFYQIMSRETQQSREMDTIHFSEDFLQILGILLHFSLYGFSFHEKSFSKRALEIFVRNIGRPQIAVGNLRIHSTAPRMSTVKQSSKTRMSRKSSENPDFFLEQI